MTIEKKFHHMSGSPEISRAEPQKKQLKKMYIAHHLRFILSAFENSSVFLCIAEDGVFF